MTRPLAPTVRPYALNKRAAAPPPGYVIAAAMLATATDLDHHGAGNGDALLWCRLYRCRLLENDRFAIQPGECNIDQVSFLNPDIMVSICQTCQKALCFKPLAQF
jgi:hypothetical protein